VGCQDGSRLVVIARFCQLSVFPMNFLSFGSFEVWFVRWRYISPSLYLASGESSERVCRSSMFRCAWSLSHCTFVLSFRAFFRLHRTPVRPGKSS